MIMKVFVINICDKRWKRYEKDERFIRWKGVNGKEDLDYDFVKEVYINFWNCKKEHRCNVAGCSESHLSLMRYIIDNKIDDVIVVEDDVDVDFNRLEILNNVNEFCYVGGHFQSPVLKRKLDREKCSSKDGINTIDTNNFTIAGGYGYYFPNHMICEKIYSAITSKPKRRAIDCEFRKLQKQKVITKYIFPAIVDLYLPVAMTGFTYNAKSNYHLKDNKHYY